MGIFDFNRAIVRRPARSVVNGLRSAPHATPDYDAIRLEHDAYVVALRSAGVLVEVLQPLERYPDSMFVEDPALVFPEGAIVLRPGAPSRLGETADMRGVLARNFPVVLELAADADAFAGFRTVLVPDGEEAASNALRINGAVFVGDCYPRTLERVAKEGFRVAALPVSGIATLDAGLSCMSLRWLAPA